MEQYEIICSKEQLSLMKEAMEFYTRFIIGQPSIPDVVKYDLVDFDCDEESRIMYDLKKYMFPELSYNASYGYTWATPKHEDNTSLKRAWALWYEIFWTIRYALDEKKDPAFVSSQMPLNPTWEKFITIKKIDE